MTYDIADLVRRVEALERQRSAATADATTGGPADAGTFWALEGLRRRRSEHPDTESGAVLFTGTLTLPTGETVEWQQAVGSGSLLDGDWAGLAAPLDALSHPVRLELLRQVLRGVRSTADLSAVESLGSTGQLHHHLRQLVAAGWLRQAGRGRYEVPVARVVPLLVVLSAAER